MKICSLWRDVLREQCKFSYEILSEAMKNRKIAGVVTRYFFHCCGRDCCGYSIQCIVCVLGLRGQESACSPSHDCLGGEERIGLDKMMQLVAGMIRFWFCASWIQHSRSPWKIYAWVVFLSWATNEREIWFIPLIIQAAPRLKGIYQGKSVNTFHNGEGFVWVFDPQIIVYFIDHAFWSEIAILDILTSAAENIWSVDRKRRASVLEGVEKMYCRYVILSFTSPLWRCEPSGASGWCG